MGKHYNIVQVGAHKGYTYNDKYITDRLKVEDNAIFIEPIKELFDIMVENHTRYKPNNDYVFINSACSNYNGTIELFVPDIEPFTYEIEKKYIEMGLPQWTDQLVSSLPNHVKNHYINLDTKSVIVDCVTLDKIINDYEIDSIGILHIDTEGHDYEVMKGINFNNIKPEIIVFENKHMDGTNSSLGEKYKEITNYLYDIGYEKTYEEDGDTHLKLKK